jgi:type II secretory pathway pseudopilin PulG
MRKLDLRPFQEWAGARSFRIVKRLSKVILIALVVIVAVLAASVAGVITYARSDDARAQIEESLTKALKSPIRLTKLEFTPWSDLRAEGVSIPAPGQAETPLVVAPTFRADYRFWPLFLGELQLHSLVLDQPHLIWAQNADEKWVWPTIEKKKSTEEPSEVSAAPKKKEKRKSSVSVTGLKLLNGTLELLDPKRRPVFVGTNVYADFTDLTDGISGKATFDKLVWNNTWVFENVTTGFHYAKGKFTLTGLDAASLSGHVHGNFEISTDADGSPFKADLEVSGVDMNALAQAAGWSAGDVGGRASGQIKVTGKTKEFARLEGPGQLTIANGHLRKLELFESLAQVLAFPELANLQPKETIVDFNLRDEKAFIDSMVLKTGTLTIKANGVARFDGKLILDSQLLVPESTFKTLPDFAGDNFTKRDDGFHVLEFKISGKTNAPKTDLAEKLIGGSVKDKVEDLLGGLFGTKTKDKDEKKKDKDKDKKKSESKPTDSAGPSPNLRQP